MAKMFPERVNDYVETSREDEAFEALKNLSKDYYVFHSFNIHHIMEDNTLVRRQCDFLVFNPLMGILCIECKNVKNITGYHKKKNTEDIINNYEGAFKQVATLADLLIGESKKVKFDDSDKTLYECCIINRAVWFLNKSEKEFFREAKNFSEFPDRNLCMFSDELKDPKKLEREIKRLMGLIPAAYHETEQINTKTSLTEIERDQVINLLKWKFCLYSFTNETGLNLEQLAVLDFMQYQPIMAIMGAAGTGKTVLAMQKARLEAAKGKKVLFICYNRLLLDFLNKKKDETQIFKSIKNNIDFYTVDGLRQRWKLKAEDWQNQIKKKLEKKKKNKITPIYNIVIVDEGQDFGEQLTDDEAVPSRQQLLEVLYNYMERGKVEPCTSKDEPFKFLNPWGSYYVFYDPLQLVQGKSIPEIVHNIDCRVPLTRNCRNTKQIAITAFSLIWGEDNKILYGPNTNYGGSDSVLTHFCANDEDLVNVLDRILENEVDAKDDTVILTAKSCDDKAGYDKKSVLLSLKSKKRFLSKKNGSLIYKLADSDKDGFLFTTIRKFKGLESKHVILIDYELNKCLENGNEEYKRLLYVAASRAHEKLDILMRNSDCEKMTKDNISKSNLPAKFCQIAENNKNNAKYDTPRKNSAEGLGTGAKYY